MYKYTVCISCVSFNHAAKFYNQGTYKVFKSLPDHRLSQNKHRKWITL